MSPRRQSSPRRRTVSPRRPSPPRRQYSPPGRRYSPPPSSPPLPRHHTLAAPRTNQQDERKRLHLTGTLPPDMASMAKEIEYDLGKSPPTGGKTSFFCPSLILFSLHSMQQSAGKSASDGNWILRTEMQNSPDKVSAGGETFLDIREALCGAALRSFSVWTIIFLAIPSVSVPHQHLRADSCKTRALKATHVSLPHTDPQ